MPKIRVLANAPSLGARNSKRGKLFETLMSDVLGHNGYRIDRIPNTNYAGMEIDIEGTHRISAQPIYVECKCYESEVESAKLQAFFGKFMSRWLNNSQSQGLFIAIPGINSHAKAFYRENCENKSQFTLRLLEEDAIIEALVSGGKLPHPSSFTSILSPSYGSAGEWNLLVTVQGLIIVQWVIPKGTIVPTHILLIDSNGKPITDRACIEEILELDPELRSQELIILGESPTVVPPRSPETDETVVEVKGGSECFEFQFPSAPEHFVGRSDILCDVLELAEKILSKSTSTRGILFEANSGWGKSSCVLASVKALQDSGHFAVAIDSRSASSSQFIFKMAEYVASRIEIDELDRHALLGSKISGYDGAADLLIKIGDYFKSTGKVAFVFLDQFENIFFLPDAFKRIRDLFLKVSSANTNLVIGFCWKTDLVGLTNEFPYQLRDSIRTSCRPIQVSRFSEGETNSLLDKLSVEIRSKLRKDLRFFLSEFSQGYPWLLKKLCAHVKAQRIRRVSQAEMANSLLNVAQLFQEDLGGLSAEEEDSLRKVARLSPVPFSDLSDDLKPAVLQSLIDRRLLVRVGTKLDVYWDIFRDFLNSGRVPAQEQYLYRLGPRSVFKAWKLINEAGRAISYDELQQLAGLTRHAAYNVVREIRMLGLATAEAEIITSLLRPTTENETHQVFRSHLAEKLRRNRLVQGMTDALEAKGAIPLNEVAEFLRVKCPYILASETTWATYAEVFCDWLGTSGLAAFDRKATLVVLHGQEVPATLLHSRRRGGTQTLQVHYSPVEAIARSLVEFMRTRRLEWPSMGSSTRGKALNTLELFGFLVQTNGLPRFTPKMRRFLDDSADYKAILRDSAMAMPSFGEFVRVLEDSCDAKRSLMELGHCLRQRLSADWSDGTSQTTAKILLDWSRHLGVAPSMYADNPRRSRM